MEQPKYRADAKGSIREVKADCVNCFRGEMEQSDSFTFEAQDCENTYKEYSQYLTAAELISCFKKAMKDM